MGNVSQKEPPAKRRMDLEIHRQLHAGETVYVIKDPISLKYFRMRKLEYFIFTLLNGRHTVEDIENIIRNRFYGLRVSQEDIKGFINYARGFNLLESVGPWGRVLYHRSLFKEDVKFKRKLLGFLFIRFPICDPDRFFTRGMGYVSFFWSRPFFGVWCGLLAFATLVAAANISEIWRHTSSFFSLQNLIIAWVATIVIKVLHEFGHGFTCKRYGGEVHELGIILLVFMPALYCDVTDAWTFARYRHRLLVSMAGIMTELFIASLACIGWWLTSPGLLNQILYNTMLISGVNSIFLNGNPLLRYDGYYVLSDYLEEPNLRQNSTRYIFGWFKRNVLRIPDTGFVPPGRRIMYLIYGPLSFLYLWVVLIGIIALVSHMFLGAGLLLAAVVVVTQILFPLVGFGVFLAKSRKEMHWKRKIWIPGVAGFLTVFPLVLVFCKTEAKTYAPCTVEPLRYAVLRAETEGFVERLYCDTGDYVNQGTVVTQLSNPELLAGHKRLLLRRDILERQLVATLAAGAIADYQKTLIQKEHLLKEIEESQARLDRLKIKTPVAGTIITPKLGEKLNEYLAKGGILCEVGESSKMTARVSVDEYNISDVRPGFAASLKFRSLPQETFKGTVMEISPASLPAVYDLAVSDKFGGDMATVTDPVALKETPLFPTYYVVITVDNKNGFLKPGMTGQARIHGQRRSLGMQLWRGILKRINPKRLI